VGSSIVLAGTYGGDRTWISAPTREFLHVEDAAEGILLATERYNASEPVNPSTLRQAQGRLSLRASLGSAFKTRPAEGVEGSAFL